MRKCEKCGKEFEKNSSYSVHRTHCLTGRRPWNEGLKLGPQSGELKKRRLEACRISHEKKYPERAKNELR